MYPDLVHRVAIKHVRYKGTWTRTYGSAAATRERCGQTTSDPQSANMNSKIVTCLDQQYETSAMTVDEKLLEDERAHMCDLLSFYISVLEVTQ